MEINLPKPAEPDTLVISYLTLRKLVGFLAILLVPSMIFGSFIFDHTSYIQISVSAYYHTNMRDLLIGIVCAISLFLLSYNGYTKQDSFVSKLAGVFALGIAFFPTSVSSDKGDLLSTLHYLTSGVFFAALAYMSVFLFTKTSGVVTPEKRKRNRVYRFCGIVMAVSVIGIPIDSIPAVHDVVGFLKPTIILETIALVSFGISWLTKGQFILKDK
jgi:hypothetical protein